MLKPWVSAVTALVCIAFSALAFSKPPQRVISLSPHLTEAIFWLGAGEKLAGRDRFSNYPEAALSVPVVGDAYSLNLEALVAQKPDLILLWQAPSQLLKQLKKLDIETFSSNPKTLPAVQRELERLATRLNIDAQQQLTALSKQIKTLEAKAQQTTDHKALLLVQSQPPIALGMGDNLAASLKYCGWSNAFPQPQAVINVNPEYLPTGAYQAVISFSPQDNRYLKKVPLLRPAADPLLRPGPRFPAALIDLCTELSAIIVP